MTEDDQMRDADAAVPVWARVPAWSWIVLVGVLAHGLVPLTDYVLWDGWWYAADLARPGGSPVMARLFHEVGRPLDMWFYLPIRWIGGDPVVVAKWLGLVAWIASAVCISVVLHRLAGLSQPLATAVAVLAAALPVFDLLGELALWMNTACVLLFWIAWVLMSWLPDRAGWRAIVVRLAALGTFFLSFDLNSNLVMFYAVACAIAGLRLPHLWPGATRARLQHAVILHLDFVALPVIFWIWKTCFTPTSGFYATGYNQPSLDPVRLATGYVGFTVHFLFHGFVDLVSSPPWWFIAVAITAAVTIIVRRTPGAATGLEPQRGMGLRLCGWGMFLLLAAAFPYIVVGQSLASEGWPSRNCILCALPTAMIVTGLLIAVNARWIPRARWAWMTGVTVLVVLGIGGCVRNYLTYQAFGVKQLSIRAKLSKLVHESNASVIQLRDYVQIPGTIPYYPPVIWTYLATGADGVPTTFVVETATIAPDIYQTGPDGGPQRVIPQIPLQPRTVDEAITATTMPYALERIPRTGAQALAMVSPNQSRLTPTDIGRRYLLLAWLAPTKALDFVQDFTTIEIHPLPDLR